MSYILYVVDTETTGLEDDHEIVELSMGRFDLFDDDISEVKTWLLKAMNPEIISDEALKISGHKREDVLHLTKYGQDNYMLPAKALPEIENWVISDDMTSDERVLVGQNIMFDFNKMLSMWQRNNALDTFPFRADHNKLVIDTKMTTLLIDICTGKKRGKRNLGSFVKSFGVKKRKAHRASEDMMMTAELLFTQLKPIKNILRDTFQNAYEDE